MINNEELFEHNLAELSCQRVVVIRPMWGTQSDSWLGDLQMTLNDYPIIFEVEGTIFTVHDVVSIEPPKANHYSKIIRLKGPHQYNENYEKIQSSH